MAANVPRKNYIFSPEALRRYVQERQRLHKRTIFGVVFLLLIIGVSIWATDGQILSDVAYTLSTLDGADGRATHNHAQNCQDPRNMRTPYCQDKKADTEQGWSAMTRYRPTSPNMFTLHKDGGGKL